MYLLLNVLKTSHVYTKITTPILTEFTELVNIAD